MAKDKEFENILNECLDWLTKGETIESCLARYPQYAAALEPLLRTALEARLAASVKPHPDFRQRAGIEFQAAIRDLPPKKGRGGFKWQVRWVAPVAIILVLLVGGTGTVVAATNSLPDSPLYAVKMATESVQLAFTFSEQGKAELYAQFVDYRVEEIVKMAEAGKSNQVEQTTERMDSQLLAMADLNLGENPQKEAAVFGLMGANEGVQEPSLTAPSMTQTTTPPSSTPEPEPPVTLTEVPQREAMVEDGSSEVTDIEKLKLLLIGKFEQNLQILRDQLEKAPEALKPALQEAIDVAENGYWLAINSLG